MDPHDLLTAVRGGRVAHTGFLDPDEGARLAASLREGGASVTLDGGYPGARRRVLTAYPEHIPEATTPLAAVYVAGVHDEADLRVALTRADLPDETLGDIVAHQDGLTVVVMRSALEEALRLERVGPQRVAPQEVALDRLASGRVKRSQVVVPSLRVDALGAKAFRVSRSYFSKGVAGGKVSVNGERAGKSSAAEPGDEVYAEGLGRFTVAKVQGETRKGNLKVELEVEES